MGAKEMENATSITTTTTGLEIAVIGMTGRFPGAKNIDEFWKNLITGKESISFFSNEALVESEIDAELLKNPSFVKAYGWMEDVEFFDAAFFGYTPSEAEIMDPQMRIFHETVFQALEDAGYDPYRYKKPISLHAGASAHFYWQARMELSGKNNFFGWFPSKQLNDKDFLCTRIAHKLSLKGPAVTVETACSTSLVAIHMACQGLLSGDCDMALAGGVSIPILNKAGYMYQEGLPNSPDGHCRAFDAKANGTNFGNASAMVALKRLDDAAADGDTIHAVIKGSSINNDGDRKASYTAPSIEGQAQVIRTAHKMAEVEPETIGYVETHGTGTTLGDPVEIEGLKSAFNTENRHFCRIGSVKTNVGHLETAAGITGFIKTVLILKHRLIPPSLFFEKPNPKIDFENSPFYVNTDLTAWKRDKYPLRAGVSSFGIGGTNVHVVLEEWPEENREGTGDRKHQLILLSAKILSALDKATENLKNHFEKNKDINLSDTAYTLQVGRRVFKHRRMLVCSNDDVDEAIDILSSPGTTSGKVKTYCSEEDNRPIVFMFSGLGSQYVNMGLDLYRTESIFREEMDRCFDILKSLVSDDIKEILYPSSMSNINQPEIAQVVVFIFEYALANLLMHWGIKPHAMIGYSFGEYVAACVSGVFSLEDALKLVVSRGQLIQKLQAGAMMSVPLAKEDLTPLLNHDVSLAIDNGPSCIVAGSNKAVDAFEKKIKENKMICMRVPVSHALHSKMMDPILREFEAMISEISLNKPQIPYISNVTGGWITDEEAKNPGYWTRHLRQTVQFADGMKELLKDSSAVFVEIGPGRDISTLAIRYFDSDSNGKHEVINLVRHPYQKVSDVYFLLNKIGKLWLYGQPIDWVGFYSEEKGQRIRIPLPTYPFERQRYWIDKDIFKGGSQMLAEKSLFHKNSDIADWFYIPSWKRTAIPAEPQVEKPARLHWLVFLDENNLGSQLVKQLEEKQQVVVTVKTGLTFQKEEDRQFTINPRQDNDYDTLFYELGRLDMIPGRIVHLWGGLVTGSTWAADMDGVVDVLELGYYSLINIARAIGNRGIKDEIQLTAVTSGMQEVTGGDGACPLKAAVLGPVKIIPREYANIRCSSIDVVLPPPGSGSGHEKKLIRQLLDELIPGTVNPVIAYRGDYRWVQIFEPMRFEESRKRNTSLREGGVYLVTGGLGGIGLALAEYLAKNVHARLILTGRKGLVADKIPKVKKLEELGAEVLVFSADVANLQQMQEVITRAEERFGPINGIIHCAGIADGEMIQLRTRETSERILASKIIGTLVLNSLFKNRGKEPDFVILCSSIASILPQIGQVGYCAANAFLDAFAHYMHTNSIDAENRLIVSVNWDRWQGVGIAVIAEKQHKKLTGEDLVGGMTGEEGVEVFGRILGEMQSQVAVSTRDLGNLLEHSYAMKASSFFEGLEKTGISKTETVRQRPELDVEYTAPGNEIEQALADIWADFFGFEQIGIHDDFFELGGDSLKALVVLPKIRKKLEVEVSIAEFFRRPTIESLGQFITVTAKKNTYSPIEPTEKKEYYALSSAQKRLYILQQMEIGSTVYNESSVTPLIGNYDQKRLEQISRELIKRHESLRTSTPSINDEPVQKVHEMDEVEFKIEYYDLTAGDKGEEDVIKTFIRSFDLVKAPLARVGVIKTDPQHYTLMVDMHHITTDAFSVQIFIKDLIAVSSAEALPPLQVQYKDYAEWQNSLQQEEIIRKQEKYWLKHFEGKVPQLNLPLDYKRTAGYGTTGYIGAAVQEAVTGRLHTISRNQDATLFMVFLAVYNVFLAKITGAEDIVIGTLTAGRNHPDLEEIMGMFVNTLALRNFPAGELTFREFLGDVRNRTLEAFENQDYQFDDLVDRVVKSREPGRNPLFDEAFSYFSKEFNPGGEIYREGDEQVTKGITDTPSKFDITLSMMEIENSLALSLNYNSKLFKEETVERFFNYFNDICTIVSENPDIKLKDIMISHELTVATSTVIEAEEGDFGF